MEAIIFRNKSVVVLRRWALSRHPSCLLLLLQPLHTATNVAVNVASPAVAAFIGFQANLGTVFRQAVLGLLRHAVWTDAVFGGMVEVIRVAFRLFQRGQELRI